MAGSTSLVQAGHRRGVRGMVHKVRVILRFPVYVPESLNKSIRASWTISGKYMVGAWKP